MSAANIVILCLRLMGIYFGVLGLSSMPALSFFLVDSESMPFWAGIPPIIMLLSGLVLFARAPRISSFIITFSEAQDGNVALAGAEKTGRIALMVLGIYIFSDALPHLAQMSCVMGLHYLELKTVSVPFVSDQHAWTEMIFPVLRFGIAIVLILGPDKVVGLLAQHDTVFNKLIKLDEPQERR
jgi:hypothetical protein